MRKTTKDQHRPSVASGLVMAMAVTMTGLLAGVEAVAQESNSFRSLGSFHRDYTTFEHAGGTVTGGSLTGTITVIESGGEPFRVGHSSLIVCVVYSKVPDEGAPDIEASCTTTDASQDRQYMIAKRNSGDMGDSGSGDGLLELLGGTGKYAGITGTCSYTTEYLSDSWHVSDTDCNWQRTGE